MIRPAEHQDLSQLLVLARKFFEVSGYSDMEFDVQTCAEMMVSCIDSDMCFVADSYGELCGFIAGAVFPSLFNKSVKCGVELAWWVEPKYRNSAVGIKLLKAIERSAQQQGVSTWSMICLEALDPDKVEDIYLRLGYQKTERTFVKRLS